MRDVGLWRANPRLPNPLTYGSLIKVANWKAFKMRVSILLKEVGRVGDRKDTGVSAVNSLPCCYAPDVKPIPLFQKASSKYLSEKEIY